MKVTGKVAAEKIADLIEAKAEKYKAWITEALEGDEEKAKGFWTELMAINAKLSDISEVIGTGPIRSIEESIEGGFELPAVDISDEQTAAALAEILG